jgi:hypothetical protein
VADLEAPAMAAVAADTFAARRIRQAAPGNGR